MCEIPEGGGDRPPTATAMTPAPVHVYLSLKGEGSTRCERVRRLDEDFGVLARVRALV